MNTLFTALIIQIALCALLFVFILYLVTRTQKLRKDIKTRVENLRTDSKDT
ncbi:MAG: hypothetical protein RIG61_13715 [Deltaproteobacteria bacterium]